MATSGFRTELKTVRDVVCVGGEYRGIQSAIECLACRVKKADRQRQPRTHNRLATRATVGHDLKAGISPKDLMRTSVDGEAGNIGPAPAVHHRCPLCSYGR